MSATVPPRLSNSTYALSRLLQLAFRQQAAEVGRLLSPRHLFAGDDLWGEEGLPSLSSWPERIAAMVKPLMTQLFQQGIVDSRRRLAGLQGGAAGAALLRLPQRIVAHHHGFPARPSISKSWMLVAKQLGVSFDLFDPMVLRAVDKATLQFCEETNDTAVGDLKESIEKLRKLLKAGLEEGKAIAQLAREVKRIFADPSRAFRIATTETSRAIHGGALLNAKESSLKLKKEWLASSNACPSCLELNGVEKELDEPFYVDGSGTYARIMTPPLHPHCFCTWTEVLA